MTLPAEYYEAARMARQDRTGDTGPTPSPVERAVRDLLHALGVEQDEHTANTPARVAKAWAHQLRGYTEDPAAHLDTTFPSGEKPARVRAEPWDPSQLMGYSQMKAPTPGELVMVSGIEVHSTCAHHLLPITGKATVAYLPAGGRVVGLSKLARLVDGYARRLQVQEALGAQVATALRDTLGAPSVACLITADHGCMSIRGVMQQDSATTTVSTAGTQWDLGLWQLITSQHQQ